MPRLVKLVCFAANRLLSCSSAGLFEGRAYLRVPVDVTWNDARTRASGLFYKGVQGSLVSIRSAAENAFVNSLRVLLLSYSS